jgi:hypothetical protein
MRDPYLAPGSDNPGLRAAPDDFTGMGFLGVGNTTAAAAGTDGGDDGAGADHIFSSLHYALSGAGAGAGAGAGCQERVGSVGAGLCSGLLDHATLYRNSNSNSNSNIGSGRNNSHTQHFHTTNGGGSIWEHGGSDIGRDVRRSKYAPDRDPHDAQNLITTDLFIYHLPKDVTTQDLETLFCQFGTSMVSARVYVDRVTHESKGFGFVSFMDKAEAHRAIEEMNGFCLGPKRLKVELKK